MNTRQLLAFDLEIARALPDGEFGAGDLGISCADIAYRPMGEPNGKIQHHTWQSLPTEDRMNEAQVGFMINDLVGMVDKGYKILTVNGAGFDFRVVAEEASGNDFKIITGMAMTHIDLCFMVVAKRGHYLGLDAMAAGLGVKGKLHDVRLNDGSLITDMSGAKAPEIWQAGERDAVLAYLKDDTRSTLQVGEVIQAVGMIQWVSKKGRFLTLHMPLMDVGECLGLPVPNNSWMDNPPTREGILSWMNKT